MKILTIVGTRPELIRLSVIIDKLDKQLGKDHIFVWTGQNYDPKLSLIFFEELGIRKPDYYQQGATQTMALQLFSIFDVVERAIIENKPDRALILGDTNSALSTIICERYKVPVYHMEAGNRCFDNKVPEEKNRKMIDAISSMNLPYVEHSKKNLLKENISNRQIYVTGNPIFEVLSRYKSNIDKSSVLSELSLKSKEYAICTIHRAENVDDKDRLQEIITGLATLSIPIIYPIHPRTKQKLQQFGITLPRNLKIIEPLGFFDFVKLEQNARIALTDSGTVQEECCLFRIPTVTIRDTTERPETVECGSNIVSTVDASKIAYSIKIALKLNCEWNYPDGYTVPNVSDIVIKKLLQVKK